MHVELVRTYEKKSSSRSLYSVHVDGAPVYGPFPIIECEAFAKGISYGVMLAENAQQARMAAHNERLARAVGGN